MRDHIISVAFLALGALALTSCSGPAERTATPVKGVDEAAIRAALEQLAPEDRKLAEAQRYCAIEHANRLGSMDTPYKLLVQGEPVFLCCAHCEKRALANPERTLKKVAQLRVVNTPAP